MCGRGRLKFLSCVICERLDPQWFMCELLDPKWFMYELLAPQVVYV